MSIVLPRTPVDLDREFAPPSEHDFDVGWRRELARVSRKARRWSQLTERIVVVLGESGSGKTAELALRAAKLRQQGHAAFAMQLGEFRSAGPESMLGGSDLHAFEDWLSGATDGTLLLDGLDEATAAGISVGVVLRTIRSWTPHAGSRLRLVLSTRPSEWNPDADLTSIRYAATGWLRDTIDATDVAVVSLLALDATRVLTYARALGVADPEEFWSVANRTGLADLMQRPLDVGWLAGRWKTERQFGALRELIDAHINERLSDRRSVGRTVNLPIDRARAGARRLAAFVTLSGSTSFPIHDPQVDAGIETHPVAILSDWRRDEVQQLFQLPIFDEGKPTTLRIHVKEVQEFLCAEWLLEQLRTSHLSYDALTALLFQSDGSSLVLAPHLRRVAAWLALDDLHLREQLIEHAPHQLMDEGDPGSLPLGARERALRGYAARYADRDRTEVYFNRRGLRRFAHAGLAPVLRDLLATEVGEDVRATLLVLVDVGEVAACADVAHDLAINSETPSHVRFAAIGAAARAGTPRHRAELAALASAPDLLEIEHLGALVRHLFPRDLSPATFRSVLMSAAPRGRWNHLGAFDRALKEDILERCPALARPGVVGAFLEAIKTSHDNWLVRYMAELAAKHLRESPQDVALPELQAALLFFDTESRHWNSDDVDVQPLVEACVTSADVRREVLRWYVERRLANGEEVSAAGLTRTLFVRGVTPADLKWLAHAVPAIRSEADAARVELERPRREVVVSYDEPRSSRSVDVISSLQQRTSEIEAGDVPLLEACVHSYQTGSDRSSLDVSRMVDELGAPLVAAVRDGLSRVWRGYAIVPPRESRRRTTPKEVVLGLMGLALDLQHDRPISLAPSEATRAARFALWELNSFPTWLPRLFDEHRDAVAKEVIDEALAELRADRGERALQKALRTSPTLAAAVTAAIESEFFSGTLSCSLRHSSLFELLVEAGTADATGWATQISRTFNAGDIEPDLHDLLWAFQFWVDPVSACTHLEQMIARAVDAERARLTALFERLWHWIDRNETDLELPLPTAERLYIALLRHRSDANDGPMAPLSRLRAELVGRLVGSGRPGRDILQSLAQRPDTPFPDMRDFHVAAANRAILATAVPLSRRNAARWVRSFDVVPETDDSLFEMVLARLSNIATVLTSHRFSYAGVFANHGAERAVEERYFQLWLAAELEHRANRQYETIREEEEYARRRPDLRAHRAGLKPTSIELKVAESWTLPELREALSVQLARQYMGEIRSQHGVLVVCATRHGRTWEGPSGDRLDVEQVIELLRTDAEALLDRAEHPARRLHVLLLDFRGPLLPQPVTRGSRRRRPSSPEPG